MTNVVVVVRAPRGKGLRSRRAKQRKAALTYRPRGQQTAASSTKETA